jgi:hypothetical protein
MRPLAFLVLFALALWIGFGSIGEPLPPALSTLPEVLP